MLHKNITTNHSWGHTLYSLTRILSCWWSFWAVNYCTINNCTHEKRSSEQTSRERWFSSPWGLLCLSWMLMENKTLERFQFCQHKESKVISSEQEEEFLSSGTGICLVAGACWGGLVSLAKPPTVQALTVFKVSGDIYHSGPMSCYNFRS